MILLFSVMIQLEGTNDCYMTNAFKVTLFGGSKYCIEVYRA